MTLDLSRLPPPQLIPIDFEADRLARMARLTQLFDEAGVAYDVEELHANPGAIHQRLDNNREMLAKFAITDVYKQTLLAFAEGASLDWFALNNHGIYRMQGEDDERFRERIVLHFENKAGGRMSGYKADCMDASLLVRAAGGWFDISNPLLPTLRLALMGPIEGTWVEQPADSPATLAYLWNGATGSIGSDVVGDVQQYIDRDDVKQATDIIQVAPVAVLTTAIDVTLYHLRGPDPDYLRRNAAIAVQAMIALRRKPHRDLPHEAIGAAATVGGVERAVVNSPIAGIVAGNGELIHVTGMIFRSQFTDG